MRERQSLSQGPRGTQAPGEGRCPAPDPFHHRLRTRWLLWWLPSPNVCATVQALEAMMHLVSKLVCAPDVHGCRS